MKIELIKIPSEEDWALCKRAALKTIWKESKTPPGPNWKHDILKAVHSPVRILNFYIGIYNIPYWVSTHLVRHVHAVPFVSTQRNDRQDMYDRNEAPQGALVNMDWLVNAEELMTIAHKRLCMQASLETREVVREICRQVVEACPEFDGLLVPLCEYRNGLCTEFHPCGKARITDDQNRN